MTTHARTVRAVQVSLVLLSTILGPSPVQAKKGGENRNREAERPDGDRDKASKDIPPAVLFGRLSPSIVVVECAEDAGKSQGSGVVIGPGQIVTSYHVVSKGKSVQIRQHKRTWSATVEAIEPHRDLAILRVKDLNLPGVTMRPSALLTVGERVYAVGAPRGLELSLSDGLVAALRRDKPEPAKKEKGSEGADEDAPPLIQTTAPVSPGSSGGGLFDQHGRLVGIITFVVKGGQNLNFAHPTEWIEELRKPKADGKTPAPGTVQSPWGLTQRPSDMKCNLDTREVWAQFSGGAELLESEAVQFPIGFRSFSSETPTFISSIQDHPEKGELVLADINRESGFVRFTSAAWLETQFGGLLFGEDSQRLRLVARESDMEYFFSADEAGRFRLTVQQTFSLKGQWRSLSLSGPCQYKIPPSKPNEKAAKLCSEGDIKACLAEGMAIEKTNRVGALALYLKGCSQRGADDAAARTMAADTCSAAARVVDRMGDRARAENLRKQAAQLREQR